MSNGFFTPIADAEVPARHQATLDRYRQLALEHGVPATAPVAYRVRAGFTLKTHAPMAGPCHDGFAYLQDWSFPDDPTADSIVFWVPRLLEGSTSKTEDQQIALLAAKRTELKLPAHHMSRYGRVALVAGLILAHHKATGECVPLDVYVVRTDTCSADGGRLCLRWDVDGVLHCNDWVDDDDAFDFVGAFVLGVELVGS